MDSSSATVNVIIAKAGKKSPRIISEAGAFAQSLMNIRLTLPMRL